MVAAESRIIAECIMAENAVVHIGENSREQVAFKLLDLVASSEGKVLRGHGANADRDYILRTYARCLYTVQNPGWVDDALKDSFGQS
jgi:hypothetical protein